MHFYWVTVYMPWYTLIKQTSGLFQIVSTFHRECQKMSGILLAISLFFSGNPDWGDGRVWIVGSCLDFVWKSGWKQRFLSKKAWKSKAQFYLKKKKKKKKTQSGNPTTHWGGLNLSGIAQLRRYCTPNQKLACFVRYLKIINTFLENDICIL